MYCVAGIRQGFLHFLQGTVQRRENSVMSSGKSSEYYPILKNTTNSRRLYTFLYRLGRLGRVQRHRVAQLLQPCDQALGGVGRT